MMVGCTDKQPKTLVLYYSQTGVTQAVAEEFAAQLGADIATFDVEKPYDADYGQTIQRCLEERATGELSPVAGLDVNLDDYDVIFLGYSVWFGTCARPMLSLLNEVDFSGKTIVPFCTFGSGGTYSSVADIVAAQPDADVRPAYGVRAARVEKAPAEITRFLINNGYIKGEKVVLPEFSEPQPITEEQLAIFDAACGSYPMPFGTPETCAERITPESACTTPARTDSGVRLHYRYFLRKANGFPRISAVIILLRSSCGVT